MSQSHAKNPAEHNAKLAHTLQVGMYFLVALLAIYVFFSITGLGTSANISYAFVVFAFIVLIVMPREFPDGSAADAAMPKTTKFLGGLGARITTTYFACALVAAALFIGVVHETPLFSFFVQAGIYVVYLFYVAYQSNSISSDTPEARAAQRGKRTGEEAMPSILRQASELASVAKGTRFEQDTARIERRLSKGPRESYQGTAELEQQMSAFLYEFTTLLKEKGDEGLMEDCARILLDLADQRNKICS